MTFLKYTSTSRFIGKGAEYPVSYVEHRNASFINSVFTGFGQSFKLAKLKPQTPKIIKMYVKMNIFFNQQCSSIFESEL